MKSLIRAVFSPLLNLFESGDAAYAYQRSHRVILLVMSVMFIGLGSLVLALLPSWDYALPVLLFGGVGSLGLLIGSVGTDRAVARIWGSR
jgi:hypothetical protein